MRDFSWFDMLWCVVKNDGTFAGVPCRSEEEARELANQHECARVFRMEVCRNKNLTDYEECIQDLKERNIPYEEGYFCNDNDVRLDRWIIVDGDCGNYLSFDMKGVFHGIG